MKRSFPLVNRGYPELMIGFADVKLCKIVGAQQAVNRTADQQQWIEDFLCNSIEATKIHA